MTTKRDIPILPGGFASNFAYGSTNIGDDYGLVGQLEHHVVKMELSIQSLIGRIRVEKSDGTCITFGATSVARPIVWTFTDADRFECIRVYTKNDRLVRIYMRTRDQKEYDTNKELKVPVSEPMQECDVPVGRGEWVGVFGDADKIVQSLGFAMRA